MVKRAPPRTTADAAADAAAAAAPLVDAFADTQPADPPAGPEALPADIQHAMDRREARKTAHDAWAARMIADGWTYGPAHESAIRTSPDLLHYDLLPVETQLAYDAA